MDFFFIVKSQVTFLVVKSGNHQKYKLVKEPCDCLNVCVYYSTSMTTIISTGTPHLIYLGPNYRYYYMQGLDTCKRSKKSRKWKGVALTQKQSVTVHTCNRSPSPLAFDVRVSSRARCSASLFSAKHRSLNLFVACSLH